MQSFLESIQSETRLIGFSGSGLSVDSGECIACLIFQSVAAGVSTFSCRNGLYQKVKERFNLSDGQKLFSFSFFEKRPNDAQVAVN